MLAEALCLRAGHKVAIWVPRRGDKLTLITNASANAEAALRRLEMERATVQTQLLRVQELFGLEKLPSRIEVYDNSHISGTSAIGAFIVATPEGFDKKSYRTFTIKDASTEPGDDYAMMREVFRRRFKGVAGRPSSVVSEESPRAVTPGLSRGPATPCSQEEVMSGEDSLRWIPAQGRDDRTESVRRPCFHPNY